MAIYIARRNFIVAFGGAAFAWPFAARAQQPARPVVGFLHSASAGPNAWETAAFRRGLDETGYADGRNISIEYRWADGQGDRLPGLAADLVRRNVAVIAAIGGDVVALAAKAATATIPIVFQNGSDPIKSGLVASINRPGGNVTGVSLFAGTVDAKRLELLHELVPNAALIAVMVNPLIAETEARSRDLEEAARALGLQLLFVDVSDEHDFEAAFATIAERKAGAFFVSGSPLFLSRRDYLTALAARHAVPATYAWRELVVAGGLTSYGASLPEAARQTGIYVGRILKGEKPADLPVLQPTKLELVINLKTAKTLGIEVSANLIAMADEVIE
jgi:putative tryptophan/tyrosine transport system substrate-binding protein